MFSSSIHENQDVVAQKFCCLLPCTSTLFCWSSCLELLPACGSCDLVPVHHVMLTDILLRTLLKSKMCNSVYSICNKKVQDGDFTRVILVQRTSSSFLFVIFVTIEQGVRSCKECSDTKGACRVGCCYQEHVAKVSGS